MSDESDPWPHEPDDPGEPDHPGKRYLDRYAQEDPAEALAPEPPAESDAPGGLFRAFWGLVATVNLGLFAASLGLMLVAFRGQVRDGGAVFLLGAAALAYSWMKYRRVRDRDWDEEEADADGASPEEAPPADDD